MSNYPPGMSKRDFVRAGIDQPHDHEHEWENNNDEWPLLEDGAAIFREKCNYAEGRYGEGWECEETRTYRFEYHSLKLDTERLIYLPDISDFDCLLKEIRDLIIEIETAAINHEDEAEILFTACRDSGEVEIRYKDYILRYEP